MAATDSDPHRSSRRTDRVLATCTRCRSRVASNGANATSERQLSLVSCVRQSITIACVSVAWIVCARSVKLTKPPKVRVHVQEMCGEHARHASPLPGAWHSRSAQFTFRAGGDHMEGTVTYVRDFRRGGVMGLREHPWLLLSGYPRGSGVAAVRAHYGIRQRLQK